MSKLRCVVVTPERQVLDESADLVVLPMFDGELGVLPKRQSLIGRLGSGELRLKTGETVQAFFVDGGFAQVREDVVSVVTTVAKPARELVVSQAEDAVRAAESATDVPAETRLKALNRARAQLRVARKAHGMPI